VESGWICSSSSPRSYILHFTGPVTPLDDICLLTAVDDISLGMVEDEFAICHLRVCIPQIIISFREKGFGCTMLSGRFDTYYHLR